MTILERRSSVCCKHDIDVTHLHCSAAGARAGNATQVGYVLTVLMGSEDSTNSHVTGAVGQTIGKRLVQQCARLANSLAVHPHRTHPHERWLAGLHTHRWGSKR